VSYTQVHIPGLIVARYERSYLTVPLVAAKAGITNTNDPASLDFPDPGLAITAVADTLAHSQQSTFVHPGGAADSVLPTWKAIHTPAALVQLQRLAVQQSGYSPIAGKQQPDGALTVWTWNLSTTEPAGAFSTGQSQTRLATENDDLFRSSL